MKKTVALSLMLISQAAQAQWAVLDEQVRILVDNINNVRGSTRQMDDLSATSNLDVDFSTVAVQNPERFIGTAADCGDRVLNQNHYNACMGLRNLRLTTLKETVDLVNVITTQDGQIKRLIDDGRSVADSEKFQVATIEIQGQQALMQADALQIKVLLDGYKQLELCTSSGSTAPASRQWFLAEFL